MVEHIPDCPFMKNSSVGWNPAVDAARRQKIREKIAKEVAHDKN